MRWLCTGAMVALVSFGHAAEPSAPSFRALDVFVDARLQPLAAYQVEVVPRCATTRVVGVEGGHRPFVEPPRYDPDALRGGRIVLAGFVLAGGRPGETRVARLHVADEGGEGCGFDVRLMVAATADGREVPAAALLRPQEQEETSK